METGLGSNDKPPVKSSQRTDRGVYRVLHVDDDPEFSEMVGTFLEREDDRFDVEQATSASIGLEWLSERTFDCVISDFDMPGCSGIEFLEDVRERSPDLPFILFTGKGTEEVASDAISAGVTDYLQKGSGTDQYELLANRVRNSVEQHRATRDVRTVQRRLQELTETTTDCLWMFDRDWDELLFISGYEDVWDRPTEALEENPRDFLESVDPDHRPRVEGAMDRLSDGESIDIEFKIRRGDDDSCWVSVKGGPVFDDDGNVVRVVGFMREITEQKERKRELERSEARYRSLTDDVLDTSDVGTFVLDSDFEIVWINKATEEYFGIDRDAVVGTDERQLIHDHVKDTVEDAAGFASTVLATYDDNTYVEEFECHVHPADDRDERWLRHWSQPIESGLYEGGRIEHYTDITEGKRREQDLVQRNERLDEFASIVSQDLRTPLDVAEGHLELVREERESEHLDVVKRTHERMGVLIDDLLTLTREGEAESDAEPIHPSTFLRKCWRNVATAEATLVTDVERDIRADSTRLRVLLENLMRNAVERGGRDVVVTVSELEGRFYVENDGEGVAEDRRNNPFEGGYTTVEDRTDFGLRIASNVAQADGWDVRVTDSSAGGTRFEVTGVEFATE